MNSFSVSDHAVCRMQQRGVMERDIELITAIGMETGDGYFVRRKDVQAFERDLKSLINRAHRLVGKRIVVEGNRLVTAYVASPRKQKRLLRKFR